MDVRRLSLLATGLALLAVAVMHLAALAPLRAIRADEVKIVDAAFALASGARPVPAAIYWSHIIPELGVINFHYPPLYFYLLAVWQILFGLSPVSTAALHMVLRALTSVALWVAARHLGLTRLASAGVVAAGAVFARGVVGRPEDLAILLFCVAVLLTVKPAQPPLRPFFAGVAVGLAFLTHPTSLLVAPLALMILIWRRAWRGWLRPTLAFGGGAVATAALWLFWIVPYWPEFQAIFLNFVLRDARGEGLARELRAFALLLFSGAWEFQWLTWQYSLVPLLTLIAYLLILALRPRTAPAEGLLMLLPLALVGAVATGAVAALPVRTSALAAALAAILAAYLGFVAASRWRAALAYWALFVPVAVIPLALTRNAVYWAPFRYFATALVIALLLGAALAAARRSRLLRHEVAVLGVLIGPVALQAALHLAQAGTSALGAAAILASCPTKPYAALYARLDGEGVMMTNSGYSYYQLRRERQLLWPAGLGPATSAGTPYSATYGPEVRWALFHSPARPPYNPGLRFSWEAASYSWFADNFALHTVAELDTCARTAPLARAVELPGALYLYERIRQ